MYRLWKVVAVLILVAAIVVWYTSPQYRWLAGLVGGLWVIGFEAYRRQGRYNTKIQGLDLHEIPIPTFVWGAFLATISGFLVALLGMHLWWLWAVVTAVASLFAYVLLFVLAVLAEKPQTA